MTSTALMTDMYELTMVRAALHTGQAFHRTLFELFPRRLPSGRSYGVVGGTGRALEAIENFRFDDEQIDYLVGAGVADDMLAEYLASYRFTGNVTGYPEGELFFSGSPCCRWRAASPRRCCWRPSCCRSTTTTRPSRRRPAA